MFTSALLVRIDKLRRPQSYLSRERNLDPHVQREIEMKGLGEARKGKKKTRHERERQDNPKDKQAASVSGTKRETLPPSVPSFALAQVLSALGSHLLCLAYPRRNDRGSRRKPIRSGFLIVATKLT